MKKNTLFIINIFLIFSLFDCHSKEAHSTPSAKSESQVNTQNQEPESIVTANADPLISENQKLFDYSLSYQEMSKIEKENRRNTLFKTIPPAKRSLYTGNDFSTSFSQNY